MKVAERVDIPENLTLGADASAMAIARGESQLEVDRRWSTVAASADADAEYPVELPADSAD